MLTNEEKMLPEKLVVYLDIIYIVSLIGKLLLIQWNWSYLSTWATKS